MSEEGKLLSNATFKCGDLQLGRLHTVGAGLTGIKMNSLPRLVEMASFIVDSVGVGRLESAPYDQFKHDAKHHLDLLKTLSEEEQVFLTDFVCPIGVVDNIVKRYNELKATS